MLERLHTLTCQLRRDRREPSVCGELWRAIERCFVVSVNQVGLSRIGLLQ